ncbi:MAG: tetratricopeptide repeat protein [Bacteroidales bacterium]
MTRALLIILLISIFINNGFSSSEKSSTDSLKPRIYSVIDNIIPDKEIQKVYDSIDRKGLYLQNKDSIEYYLQIAESYKNLAELDKTLNYLHQAKQLSEKKDNPLMDIEIHNKIGTIYRMQGHYSKALKRHETAMKIAKDINNDEKKYETNYYIGLVRRNEGQNGKEFERYYESLQWFEKNDKKQKMARVLNSMGNGYRVLKQNDLALEYYDRSLRLYEKLNDSIQISKVLNNKGLSLMNKGKYNEALECYYKGLKIDKRNMQILMMSRKLNNIGYVYIKLSNYNEALKYLNKALAIKKMMNSESDIAFTHYRMGICYSHLREYDVALNYMQQAYQESQELSNISLIHSTANQLSSLYYQKENYQEAFNYRRIAEKYKDSTFNPRNIMRVGAAEAKNYKDTQIQNLHEKREKTQKNFFWAIVVVSIGLGGLAIFTVKQKQIIRTQKRQIGEKQQLKQALDNKKSEIHSKNLQLLSKGQMIKKLSKQLNEFKSSLHTPQKAEIQNFINELNTGTDEKLYEEIELIKGEDGDDFFRKLGELSPKLTPNERKLCALLKLNLSTKEISKITRQSPQSIRVARSRVRKKLNISNKTNLTNFLTDL